MYPELLAPLPEAKPEPEREKAEEVKLLSPASPIQKKKAVFDIQLTH